MTYNNFPNEFLAAQMRSLRLTHLRSNGAPLARGSAMNVPVNIGSVVLNSRFCNFSILGSVTTNATYSRADYHRSGTRRNKVQIFQEWPLHCHEKAGDVRSERGMGPKVQFCTTFPLLGKHV